MVQVVLQDSNWCMASLPPITELSGAQLHPESNYWQRMNISVVKVSDCFRVILFHSTSQGQPGREN